jgi:two-component system sensor histidine kinase BaeS
VRIRPANNLAARLFAAQTLVAVAGAATLWVVAAVIGPAIFQSHLNQAQVAQVSADTARHVDEAFRSASAVSIGVALLASLVAALAISAFATRRIAGPVVRLADAAGDVAAGRFDVRVPDPALGSEFAGLASSFNGMAQRLQAVETTRRRLLADLAHEMRTPLATLDAYLEALEDGVAVMNPETVALLRAQTGRLGRLTEDVSAVSRAEEGQLDLHPQVLPADGVISRAAAAARERYDAKGVTLATDTAPRPGRVAADPERMEEVLGNLLDNALRHTPAGGTVLLACRHVAAVEPRGGGVEFSVSDTGDGIPAEHLPHVFERFYRVDRARDRAHGGSGIGLAITKALVEAHGGTVTASSAGLGHGAVFTVRLPAVIDR